LTLLKSRFCFPSLCCSIYIKEQNSSSIVVSHRWS
jgi:hypothetical protein